MATKPWKLADGRVRLGLAIPVAALLAAAGPEDRDPDASPTVGTVVVLKGAGTVIRDGARVVATNARHRTYRVAKVEEGRLRVVAGGVEGWVGRDEAVALDEAMRQDTAAIRDHPDDATAYHHRGLLWFDQREYDIAIRDLDEAIRLDPKGAEARVNRGIARAAAGDPDGAVADFEEAIRLDPRLASAFAERGIARSRKRDEAGAVADFEEAIRLDPTCGAAYNGLAWLLATSPEAGLRDGARAVALATRANQLTGWRAPYDLGTLAASCAEAGDFDAAERWQARALDLFPKGDPGLKAHRGRLELYRSKCPYRDSGADWSVERR